jgi:biopolymer transport protein TolR
MSGKERSQIRCEINVTPLIDVCLVLLIVFMVITPILVRGPVIDLPKAADPKKIDPAPNQFPIVLVFDRPPQILFGPDFRWIRRDRFPAEVAALHEADPNRPILLRADRKLSYGDVKDVMRTLRDAGFRNVGLIAEKQSAPAGAR